MGLKKYTLKGQPEGCAESMITGDRFRITMLTDSLVRFEYSEDGSFEDRATQMVCNREFPVPEFKVRETQEELHIYTKALQVHYDKKKFTPGGLMVQVAGGRVAEGIWHYGEEPKDLLGTARTLDEADGAIPLEHGIMSKNGYSVLDDSRTMALKMDGTVEPRSGNKIDFYFFGYGHRYLECLHDFYLLCGETPLLPRFAFGNWWSRYHKYDETEYKELMERFEKEKIPFSVSVVDMDWHLVDDVDPVYGSGWTGYTWNRSLFPDPREFMTWLHNREMKITLNVHPADGIRAYEDAYPAAAKRMGIDPASKEPVLFDITDPAFVETYFEEVHHPMEEEGVDFWWIDWQQGSVTKVPGLDPLWMLNHYHYLDSKWKGKRALTFSRYAGPGSHRYPIGFSGDTIITWKSLAFQPYFTANASNIGYGWWSHDIGGHMLGSRDDELTARWVQLGVFSPINRLHSSDNPFSGKEPWKYNKTVEQIMKEFLTLRHSLIPYLYTMNRIANKEGRPLVLPMYYLEPEQKEAYEVPNNFYFGTELMVSPITEPVDSQSLTAKAKTWIPEGIWYDFFHAGKYQGDRMINVWRSIEEMPVLAKEGAIIPMKDMEAFDNSIENPDKMLVRIFPGAEGSFVLWEDDGDSPEDREENWAYSVMKKSMENGTASFEIEGAKGNLSVLPKTRSWKLQFAGTENTKRSVWIGEKEIQAEWNYKKEYHGMEVKLTDIPVTETIKVKYEEKEVKEKTEDIMMKWLERSQISYDKKLEIYQLVQKQGKDAVLSLAAMELSPALFGTLCEILTCQ